MEWWEFPHPNSVWFALTLSLSHCTDAAGFGAVGERLHLKGSSGVSLHSFEARTAPSPDVIKMERTTECMWYPEVAVGIMEVITQG